MDTHAVNYVSKNARSYFRLANDTQIAYEVKYEGQRYIVVSYADGTEMFFSTVDD